MKTLKLLVGLLMVISIIGCFDCEKFFSTEFRPDYINGIIINKYRDPNHDIPNIEIKQLNKSQGEYVLTLLEFSEDFWKRAQIGDTILKKKGTTEVKLIKRDSTFSYYPECNGQQVR